MLFKGFLGRLSVPKVSARLLRAEFHYVRVLGVINFGLKNTTTTGELKAYPCHWYKWFCLVNRVVWCIFYTYMAKQTALKDQYLQILAYARGISCLICTASLPVLQLCYGKRILRLVNRFLRLFRRVRALTGPRGRVGFGGTRELILMVSKLMCLFFEVLFELPYLLHLDSWISVLAAICDFFTILGAGMIMHICFVGYLSVGALYEELNSYARRELRRQLRSLQHCQHNRSQLKAVGKRLDEYVAIYDEIQRVGQAFHKLFELPLWLSLCMDLFLVLLICYYVIIETKYEYYTLWFMLGKLLIDVILLTLAVHGAVSSSRVVRRLSLENCYVSDQKEWHMKFELFLGRLNCFEFRVRPLGLFDISNDFILFFLSGLLTFITYLAQSNMQQSHKE